MIMTNQNFRDLILLYENYIQKGNEYLKFDFHLSKSPLLAKRRGELPASGQIVDKNFSFQFHGMGCVFKFGDLFVDFDYSFSDFIYKGFELSKLHSFISSYLKVNGLPQISISETAQLVFNLEKSGVLREKEENSIDTYEYTLVDR
ncbi:hypothetical protein D3C72_965630 [compost metagenome]